MKKMTILNLALIILSLGLTAQENPEQKTKEPSEAGKSFVCGASTVNDIDGNIYNTVLIGDQCWMKENLKTTKYRNGTPIDYPGADNNVWNSNTAGAYAWYENDNTWKNLYGALYNGYTIHNANGLCPSGWHVPGFLDFTQMRDYVVAQGYPDVESNPDGAGNALKSCRQVNSPFGDDCNTTEHPRWESFGYPCDGFDAFGFSALPGGRRKTDGTFIMIGTFGWWWTSHMTSYPWFYNMSNTSTKVGNPDWASGLNGFSVRCIKDENSQVNLPTISTSGITQIAFNSATSGGNVTNDGGAEVTARGIVWSSSENPTLELNDGFTIDGAGLGEFTSNLAGLSPDTEYFVKAYATNIAGTGYGEEISFTTNESGAFNCGDPLIDARDGQSYTTVQIGDQCWMAQSLNLGTRINGNNDQTDNGTIEKYCFENTDANCDAYGGLYQWNEMMNYNATPGVQGICPESWHLPTDAQWTQLVDYVVSQGYPNEWENPNGCGNALKSCRQENSPLGGECNTTEHPRWNSHNTYHGFDEFGFSGFPGGFRNTNGTFYNIGGSVLYWSSTDNSSASAWARYLYYGSGDMNHGDYTKGSGFSVRCVLDETSVILLPTITTETIAEITATTATSGGNVTDDGGAEVTACGVVWSTTQNPTIESNEGITYDGVGLGEFISYLIGLSPDTEYFVKAYATNIAGTAYGEQLSFFTPEEEEEFAGGSGAWDDPYLVATASQLNNVRYYLSSYFKLIADINLGVAPWNIGEGWIPIGDSWETKFTGHLYGDGHTIDGLKIYRPDGDYQGLFGYIYGAHIEKLGLTNVDITGNDYTAALAGVNHSKLPGIEFCFSTGVVNGNNRVGGLAGTNYWAFLQNSYSFCSVTGNDRVGGLVGENWAESGILNCFSIGVVIGNLNVGGLTGYNESEIIASYWNTETSGQTLGSGGEGRTTTEMTFPYAVNTYTGWDFEDIWVADVNSNVNDGYPYLFWQQPHAVLPTVTTASISNITQTTAISGGEVTDDGGAEVTARGVVWSTSQNPTVETNEGITYDGEGTGSWVSELVELTPVTEYFVRSYATNSIGTAYGDELNFTTLDEGCAPGWVPTSYNQFNMQVIGQIYLNGEPSDNPSHVLGAFVDGECRGVASPDPGLMGLVFLSVGSDLSSGEMVEFLIWDADLCEECPTGVSITFENQEQIGSAGNPYPFECGLYELNLEFGAGYTWFSVNIDPGSMMLNNLFEPLDPCEEDRILGQHSFATYYMDQWVGSLNAINPSEMYKMQLCSQQNLTIEGQPVANDAILLGTGYTWLGYLPQESMAINNALADITPTPSEDNRLLSQHAFAVWYQGQWVGSLTHLQPGKGYIAQLSSQSILQYPFAGAKVELLPEGEIISPTGEQPLTNKQFSMMLVAQLELPDGSISLNPEDVIYAYSGDECRGMAIPHEEHNGAIFMSIGADVQAGEEITFKAWLSEFGTLEDINETISFEALKKAGTMEQPVLLTLKGFTGTTEGIAGGIVIGEPFPNPFSEVTEIPYRLNETARVKLTIYNSHSQTLRILTDAIKHPGAHKATIHREGLQAGVYFYRMEIFIDGEAVQKNGKIIISQ